MESGDVRVDTSQPGTDIVILTATVTPNVTHRLTLADPQIRLEQYQAAIARWGRVLEPSGFHLAVVETSGARRDDLLYALPLDKHAAVRTFDYHPSDSQVSRGKGAIELGAIAYVLARHPGVGPASSVYKCTGRLPLLNASRIVRPVEPGRVRIRMMADRSWVDTRLIGARAPVWDELVNTCSDAVDERLGYDLERVAAAHFASKAALKQLQIERFRERPVFEGVSGTSGRTYAPLSARGRDALMRPIENLLAGIASRKQV